MNGGRGSERSASSTLKPCCYREQLGYALYATFREPKLYRMAASGDWVDIPSRCRSHPKEAAFVHKYPPSDTALHRIVRASFTVSTTGSAGALPTACNDGTCSIASREDQDDQGTVSMDQETIERFVNLKLTAIRALLQANSPAASLTDTFGRTPLHLACMDVNEGGAAIALEILRANPLAALAADVQEQRTPLHFLVARHTHIPTELLDELVTACGDRSQPAAMLQHRDICGETTRDIVERRRNEIHNVQAILDKLEVAASSVTIMETQAPE